jgi:hypothetical protein
VVVVVVMMLVMMMAVVVLIVDVWLGSYNLIEEIPMRIFRIKDVKELYLHHNRLRILPANMGVLHDLRVSYGGR